MNRHAYALAAARAPHQEPLLNLASGFFNAVSQVFAEGGDPGRDPAVLVLGSFIGFQTHFDVNTGTGYMELLNICEQNVLNERPLQ
jgi:hypothetical protein